MKKIFLIAISGAVLLSAVIIIIATGVLRPKCDISFATAATFQSTTINEDGELQTDNYDISAEALEMLKEAFNGQRIYAQESPKSFENYIFLFTNGQKTVWIRLADDGSNIVKHNDGYFTMTPEQRELLFSIVYDYL